MTVRLSPHKVSRMMRLYFTGVPQPEIAKRVGVDQSTVSIYASRFKERVSEAGLEIVGKEISVFSEVEALRSLSVELEKAGLTIEDARRGVGVVRAFHKSGVSTEQYLILAKACKEAGDPGFLQAALKLARLELKTGEGYEDVIARFDKALAELPQATSKLNSARAELQAVDRTITGRKQQVADLNAAIKRCQGEATAKKTAVKQELSALMKKSGVRQSEVEQIASLKKTLSKQGLDIDTLVKLAKEFGYGSDKV